MRRTRKPTTRLKFSYTEWHWTCAHENLFELDAEALFCYRYLVRLL